MAVFFDTVLSASDRCIRYGTPAQRTCSPTVTYVYRKLRYAVQYHSISTNPELVAYMYTQEQNSQRLKVCLHCASSYCKGQVYEYELKCEFLT